MLDELEKPVTATLRHDRVEVESDLGRTELSHEDFVEATVGRLPEAHQMDGPLRRLLTTVP